MSHRLSAPLHLPQPIQLGPNIELVSTPMGALVVRDGNPDARDPVRSAEADDLDLATQRLDWLDVCPDDGDPEVSVIVGTYTVRRCLCTDGTWRLYATPRGSRNILILDPEMPLRDHFATLVG